MRWEERDRERIIFKLWELIMLISNTGMMYGWAMSEETAMAKHMKASP